MTRGTVRFTASRCVTSCARCCTVIFGCVEEVLRKTRTKPRQIDFLMYVGVVAVVVLSSLVTGCAAVLAVPLCSVNCSLFAPTPSLCAMVVNKYVPQWRLGARVTSQSSRSH